MQVREFGVHGIVDIGALSPSGTLINHRAFLSAFLQFFEDLICAEEIDSHSGFVA